MSTATNKTLRPVATKPAQFTVSFEIEGFPVTAQLEGKADGAKAMIDRLKAIGATPPAKAEAAPSPAPIERKSAPPQSNGKSATKKEAPLNEAKNGARVTIAFNGESFTGTITDQPVTGKMAIVIRERVYFGYVSAHSPTKYRLLINNRIALEPIATTQLIRLDAPPRARQA